MSGRLSEVLALVCWCLTAACGGVEAEAGAAVEAYNRALIEAYRLSDASRLEGIATDIEVRKVFALIDLKKADRLVLESELESFAVTSVVPTGPEGAVVETEERWRYYDRPLMPGAPSGPEFVAEMTMRYELVRRGERWLMNKGRTLTNEILEPAGHTPEPHRAPGAAAEGAPGGQQRLN